MNLKEPMGKFTLLIAAYFIAQVSDAQTLQSVTTPSNTTTNAVRLLGDANAGSSGAGELFLGLFNSNKINDTRTFIGWKNTGNTITNGIAGTLLLQGRSDLAAPIDFATGLGTPSLRMRIAGDGSVSIQSKLTVANNVWHESLDGAPRVYYGLNDRSYYASKNGFEFRNASDAPVMLLTNTGEISLGMGATTPLAKLDVNGNIFCRSKLYVGVGIPPADVTTRITNYELAVNGRAIFNNAKVMLYASQWPDYVFDKNYELLSLKEVEEYIKTHKHLPEVIPANEAEKEGIDIGGTEAILLKKIEELTLYAIDQDKVLKQQQAQINLLIAELTKVKADLKK